MVNTGWQWPAVVPTQKATNKPKTDQENHIVRDPSYNIARLTRDVMDLRKKFERCSIDKIAGIDSLVFGHSSATAIRPPIVGPQ